MPPPTWTVELRGGTYPGGLTADGARCLGVGVPIIIQGRAGEIATLSGGLQIPTAKLAKGAGKPLTVSLPALGLPLGSYGGVEKLSCGALSSIEVFVNGEPLTLARWPNINPNTGFWEWGSVKTVEEPGPNAQFTLATAKSATCLNPVSPSQLTAWGKEKDLWTHGYWGFDWADSYAKVGAVFPNATMRLAGTNRQHLEQEGGATATATPFVSEGDGAKYPVKPKARFMVVNALSELDAPGEYFVDRST